MPEVRPGRTRSFTCVAHARHPRWLFFAAMSAARHPLARARFFRWSRRTLIVLAIFVLLLLALRIAAPFVVRDAVNRRLSQIDGYRGQVADVDLQLLRGGYRINRFQLDRHVGDDFKAFASAGEIDFTLAWRELLRGRVLSDIEATDATLTYVPVPEDQTAAPIDEPPWQDVINDLFPIEITHFVVHRGRIRLEDEEAEPPVDVGLEALELVATGLRNRPVRGGEERPAHIRLYGTTVGGGRVELYATAEPLAPEPHFDLNLAIEGVDLPALNDYLRAYANVDVSEGTFMMYAELAASEGRFEGYVKPFFENVTFEDYPHQEKPVLSRIWETLVSAVATLLKNKPRDQVATRIPLSSEFGDPEIGFWATVGNLFRHGFIEAFTEDIEGTVEPEEAEPAGGADDRREEND